MKTPAHTFKAHAPKVLPLIQNGKADKNHLNFTAMRNGPLKSPTTERSRQRLNKKDYVELST